MRAVVDALLLETVRLLEGTIGSSNHQLVPLEDLVVAAASVVVPVDFDREQSTPVTGASDRAGRGSSACDEARQQELTRCLLLQLAMCGALVNRDAIEFARGIAEVLIWSAEHARAAADAKVAFHDREIDEWQCITCGEPVPGNFELCWNCETDRPPA